MSSGEQLDIEEIFAAAAELPESQRDEFLTRECKGDAVAEHTIRELLIADQGAGRFMARPTIDPNLQDAEPPAVSEGDQVGNYRILTKLGEGGFGAVYRAEQLEPVRREVALKLMKRTRDVEAMMARFEFEKQALAQMGHPGIATVFDAGITEDGPPFVAMELVDGMPITHFCGGAGLEPGKRLRLFIKVCQAVQHAHGKGVIHRDLKPANILVVERDGEPVPVIIDFGIASTGNDGRSSCAGTPAYSSPESQGGDGDARGDVYSLGVLLHELLCGDLPGEGGVVEGAIVPELRSVLGKALSPRAEERYGSVGELGNDIRRYLRSELVEAHPQTTTYRIRKFVRRHRVGVTASAFSIALIVGALCICAYGLLRARSDAHRAELEAGRARAVSQLLDEMLASADPSLSKGPDYRLVQLLDEFDSELGLQLAGQPDVEYSIRLTLGRAYSGLGEYEKSLRHFVLAAELAQELHGVQSASYAEAQRGQGVALTGLGHRVDAIKTLRHALRTHRAIATGGTSAIRTTVSLIDALKSHGGTDEASTIARRIAPKAPFTSMAAGDAAQAYNILAETLFEDGDIDGAERLANYCVALANQRWQDGHPRSVRALLLLARINHARGELAAAESLFEEAEQIARTRLTDDHPLTASVLKTRAEAHLQSGDLKKSETKFLAAVALLVSRHGASHPETLRTMLGLVKSLVRQKKLEDATEMVEGETGVSLSAYLRGESIRVDDLSPPLRAIIASGRYADFAPLVDSVRGAAAEHLGPTDDVTLAVIRLQAHLMQQMGRHAEALPLALEALEGYRSRYAVDHPLVLDCTLDLEHLYRELGNEEEAGELEFRLPGGEERSEPGRASYLRVKGVRLRNTGALRASERTFKRSLQLAGDHPDTREATLRELAFLYRLIDADVLALEALEEAAELTGDLPPELASELAEAHVSRFGFESGRRIAQGALDAGARGTVEGRLQKILAKARDRPAKQLAALEVTGKGKEKSEIDLRYRNLGRLVRAGKLQRAAAELDLLVPMVKRQYGEDTAPWLWVSTMRGWIGDWHNRLADPEVEAHYHHALDRGLEKFGPRDDFTYSTAMNFAVYLRARGRIGELRGRFVRDAEQRTHLLWSGEVTELVPLGSDWQYAVGGKQWSRSAEPAPLGAGNDDIAMAVTSDRDVSGSKMRVRRVFHIGSPDRFDEYKLILFYAGRCRANLNGAELELPERARPSDELDLLYPEVLKIDVAHLRTGENTITFSLDAATNPKVGLFVEAGIVAR